MTKPNGPDLPTRDAHQLEDLLSAPTRGVIDALGRLEGDLIVLGVGGKMGPTLARMARRASDQAGVDRRVIGVSRFSDPGLEVRLQGHGIETIPCDLLEPDQVAQLPEAPLVVYMAGMKFGTSANAALTWAMNTVIPSYVAQRYHHSRIVAFATGNVYGLTAPDSGGSKEEDTPDPVGEYAQSALGRERVFEHYSRTQGTPVALIRLNYAVELRYGVLVDLARWVWQERPIDLAMGHANVIWQGDANAMALQALEHAASPPTVLNVTGPEVVSIQKVCEKFGALMHKPVRFTGQPAENALLNNSAKATALFGPPSVSVDQMISWITYWVMAGGASLGKPTHFEVRDGKF